MAEVRGTVRWVRGDQFGIRLREPISVHDLDRLSQRALDVRPGFQVIPLEGWED